ncbi:hypothetical protein SDC9_111522 [bioreactor metagenome]|uniref:Uncharacterized protein n=1 Tax=bioreactor metagenome TaxID=1076179 RepID=A0A645BGY3_9ZZZZ
MILKTWTLTGLTTTSISPDSEGHPVDPVWINRLILVFSDIFRIKPTRFLSGMFFLLKNSVWQETFPDSYSADRFLSCYKFH